MYRVSPVGGGPLVRVGLGAAVATMLAGCGGNGPADAPAPTRTPAAAGTAQSAPAASEAPAAKAAELVYFQRQGEGGATLDTVSVRVDGTATYDRRHGGAGGRFKELVLRRGQLARVRRALAALPKQGSSLTRGSPPPGWGAIPAALRRPHADRPPGRDRPFSPPRGAAPRRLPAR